MTWLSPGAVAVILLALAALAIAATAALTLRRPRHRGAHRRPRTPITATSSKE